MSDELEAFLGAAVIGFTGYVMWRRNMRAASLMEGTATSRVATAAKGYVELFGIAREAGEAPVSDPVQHQGCLWFKVVTERYNGKSWEVVHRESSTAPLALQDDSGSCLIVPGEANIDEEQDPDAIVRDGVSRRYKIWRVAQGDPLYALGFLERRRAAPLEGAIPVGITAGQAEVGLLRVWKRDQAKLLGRFDLDGNGRIDAAEWERARVAARDTVAGHLAREAAGAQVAAAAAPDAEIGYRLRRPDDDRPLIVSSRPEAEVLRRLRRRSWVGLAMFVAGTLYVLYALGRYFA
ncbi:MAG: hypothetical protein CMLOHMNK_01218 [Steroidobacteraceae bacterium]|nr:hypothetical protein [Steroidobacteraceae bacterium]